MKTTRVVLLGALGLALTVLPSAARADGFQIFKKDGNAAPVLVKDLSGFMTDAMNNYLKRNRTKIEEAIKKELGRGDLIARGISLYDLNCRLGTPSFRYTSVNGFRIDLKGNYLYARSTTPTALGKWADPAFEVHFDLRLTGGLQLPTRDNPKVKLVNTVVSVPHVKVKPRNVTGGVITTMARISDFFYSAATGQSFIRRAADKYLRLDITDSANAWAGLINGPLQRLSQEGYKEVRTALNRAGNVVEIHMSRARTIGRARPTAPAGANRPAPSGTASLPGGGLR